MPSFKKMETFLREWNLGTNDQRDLFLNVSNILKDNKGSAKDSYSFLLKYLATFASEDAYTLSEAKEEAVRAIMEFVKAPDMFQCDLLGMPAVGQLEKDGKYAWVYRLLEIFLTHRLDAYLEFQTANSALLKSYDMPAVGQLEKDGKYAWVYCLLEIFLTYRLDAYLEFQTANSALLKSYGLVHEDCITKMRLMSLADLGSKGSGEISYASVRDTLRIPDDEVEFWIVRAISSKLLDCKMDQMHQVAIVSRCTERVFGPTQWRELHSKLVIWRDNIANVVKIVQDARSSGEIPQAMQGVVH